MTEDNASGVSRRAVLKKGALVGGTMLWVVPTVQALGTAAASADTASGNEKPVTHVKGTKHHRSTPTPQAVSPAVAGSSLPHTGAGSAVPIAVAGAALVAGGVAARKFAAVREPHTPEDSGS